MTADDIRGLVRAHAEAHGSLRALARAWGVTAAYLSDILRGKREPGPTILDRLGIERTVTVSVEYRAKVA